MPFRLFALLLLVTPWSAIANPPQQTAVASAHPAATHAGMEIMAAGGNAFDAAVAISAALAVAEPYSSGIGGGGFWLLHQQQQDRQIMVDGRETAPLAAHRDMYLDESGELIPGASMDGPLAAGIPGAPAAWVHIAEHYGQLPLARSLAPAIRLAREGFAVTPHYRRMAEFRRDAIRDAAAEVFLDGGEVPAEGYIIKQPALAETLSRLAEQGRDGFYSGETARRLVEGSRAAGGIWTLEDLAQYQIKERAPITAEYRGMQVVSASPPSSGGVALATMLHILDRYPPPLADGVAGIHRIVEAMRRAYRDRALYLGDSDFVEVPVERLSHPWYAAGLASAIHPQRATPSADLPGLPLKEGAQDTSHFSVIDAQGNAVAATLSINYPFGSGFMPPGTGVLLNDEMDDFSAKPGTPNAYGLVGAEANAIAPGKRMLSSMSPTLVKRDDGLALLGSPGGSRIITMVLLGILEMERDRDPARWVALPRFHHQYLPDKLFFESDAFNREQQQQLAEMGHQLEEKSSPYGNMQALFWDYASGQVKAASDPRGEGLALSSPPHQNGLGSTPK
jgi:gamma-glutamyltranspeptidase/glutathione hydrolase